ncbi:MAG: modification methylase, partial [Hyphomicrobiales bacterium]|nr:modification methylase [Hyphomicrobiales bacterium]
DRRFLGFERDAGYAEAARARIAAALPLPAQAVAPAPSKRAAPRVAFAALVEAGLVAAGETLVDARRRTTALVRADGAVALGDIVGSIHKTGALAQGLPACNGWDFWHVEREGLLRPIDFLRGQARAAMAVAAE